MGVNRVVMNTEEGEKVLVDLTEDTIEPDMLDMGETAHNAAGETIVGSRDPHAVVTTTGTGDAYLAEVKGVTELKPGIRFVMVPHTSCTTIAPSLDVNGLGAKAIRRRVTNSTATTATGTMTGWLVANKPVHVLYDGTFWIVEGMERPNAVDLMGMVPMDNIPEELIASAETAGGKIVLSGGSMISPGWYRFAKMTAFGTGDIEGGLGISCQFDINRTYMHNANESYTLLYNAVYNQSKLTVLNSIAYTHYIKKLRLVKDTADELIGYWEIYYDGTLENPIRIACTSYQTALEPLPIALSTSEPAVVISEHDISPNASATNGTVKSVNGIQPDETGNVTITIPANFVKSVNGVAPDANGNVTITIPTVSTSQNGLTPKLSGSTAQYLRGDGSWATPPDTNTTYGQVSTSSAGLAPKLSGSTSQYLRGDGSWATPPDTNTTYGVATTGSNGLLRALNGSTSSFLRGDGNWATPPNTTYSTATTSAAGLLRALNGSTSQYLRGDGVWGTPPNTTYGVATTSANGLMSAAMVTKLNGIEAGAIGVGSIYHKYLWMDKAPPSSAYTHDAGGYRVLFGAINTFSGWSSVTGTLIALIPMGCYSTSDSSFIGPTAIIDKYNYPSGQDQVRGIGQNASQRMRAIVLALWY